MTYRAGFVICLLFTLSGWAEAQPNPTQADADRAYAAFNQAFYNPEAKLYYGTTQREGVAAIWTQAIYWDMAMDVYERTQSPAQQQRITDLYEGNGRQYAQYDWTNHKVWFIYDDMMWWVMAFARAHKLTHNPTYLQRAVSGFNHVWEGSYDSVDGGMFWNFKHSGKNACINYPTVIAALRLYELTNDTTYLGKAKRVYAWARANLFEPTSGRVADHKIGKGRPGYEDYTYNQGTCIGAATGLYAITHEATYLNDAKLAADYTRDRMSRDGILPAEGDFNEQGILKAIFAQYMVPLATTYRQRQYLPWLRKNAQLGWQNRDRHRDLTHRDYRIPCPTGPIQSYEASSVVMLMQLLSAKPRK
ncbi:glycoside hydrolase family 76 protein [Fibrella sp. WM1]|uniref:glycoside hydrolase family 76 protein n=1 Tax=Fibrella musci TaxID=3242485 RepID=UPI00351F9DB8